MRDKHALTILRGKFNRLSADRIGFDVFKQRREVKIVISFEIVNFYFLAQLVDRADVSLVKFDEKLALASQKIKHIAHQKQLRRLYLAAF